MPAMICAKCHKIHQVTPQKAIRCFCDGLYDKGNQCFTVARCLHGMKSTKNPQVRNNWADCYEKLTRQENG